MDQEEYQQYSEINTSTSTQSPSIPTNTQNQNNNNNNNNNNINNRQSPFNNPFDINTLENQMAVVTINKAVTIELTNTYNKIKELEAQLEKSKRRERAAVTEVALLRCTNEQLQTRMHEKDKLIVHLQNSYHTMNKALINQFEQINQAKEARNQERNNAQQMHHHQLVNNTAWQQTHTITNDDDIIMDDNASYELNTDNANVDFKFDYSNDNDIDNDSTNDDDSGTDKRINTTTTSTVRPKLGGSTAPAAISSDNEEQNNDKIQVDGTVQQNNTTNNTPNM